MDGPNVLLIGLRCSGKSTVGPLIAKAMGFAFIDLDEETLRRLRCATVEEAWRAFGEARFREAEVEGLRDAMAKPGRVIAAGGGTPTAPGAAELIREHVKRGDVRVMYLRGLPETLRKRFADDDPNRPSLTGVGGAYEFDQVFAARDDLYQKLAHCLIDVDQPTERVVAETLARIKTWSGGD